MAEEEVKLVEKKKPAPGESWEVLKDLKARAEAKARKEWHEKRKALTKKK